MKTCSYCGKTYDNLFVVCPSDNTTLIEHISAGSDPWLGKLLAGCYRLDKKIGEGVMSAVYKAHTEMGRTCAIKLITHLSPANDDAVARFKREAKMASRIDSAHAVTIYDFGQSDDGMLFLALEFIDGVALSRLLSREPKLSLARAVHIASQIAEALAAAHALEITHRDLKPDNIMITRNGAASDYVKVLDFGIAKTVTDDSADNLTKTGFVLGTPVYMSPEQLLGEKLDPRSDIYSLAIIVYEMLSGRLPFEGDNQQSIMMKRITSEPVRISWVLPGVSDALERAVMDGLTREPAARTRSVEAFAAALNSALLLSGRATERISAGQQPVLETKEWAALQTSGEPPLYVDDNVQFTVFQPKVVRPLEWYPLLAFAHLAERRPDAKEDDPDPIEEVKNQAQKRLGDHITSYKNSTQDSMQAVPREGELTFIPNIPGVEFNPQRRSFFWMKTVHCEDFDMRASPSVDGQTVRGRLTVFLGSILIAEVNLSIRVDSQHLIESQKGDAIARPFRKIFASYSHRDRDIVEQFEHYALAIGDRYLRDLTHLQAGEVWNDRLEQMIVEADIFQLFWSSNAMVSWFVKREWEYALKLGRPNFIRPTYWEEPLPSSPDKSLPPEELLRLHFQRIHSVVASKSSVTARETIVGNLEIPTSASSASMRWSHGYAPASLAEQLDSVSRPQRTAAPLSPPDLGTHTDQRILQPKRKSPIWVPSIAIILPLTIVLLIILLMTDC